MVTVASMEAMIRECTSSQIDRCCAGEAQQSRVLISVGTGSGTREWLTLDPYRPVRGDPRLRAVISPSDPTQDVHFADIFNAISPAEHSACSANLYG